jgi:hypothetical protein
MQIGQFGHDPGRQADRRTAVQNGGSVSGYQPGVA